MKIMNFIVKSVLFLSFIAITTQDITGRKGCDCSICKSVDNKINLIVGKKISDGGGGKSSCNLCEQRKEMIRLERERQRQMQKCPYELLGSPVLKGKTSHEVFDEFRELIVPSQNGFFDMMRGIVRTMHFTSEAELKLAKEKEARELAEKKKKEEEEKAKKRKEFKHHKEEIVSLSNPVNPKVTVVLKQTPCGQIVAPSEKTEPEEVSLLKRFPKETNRETYGIPEEEVLDLQTIEFKSNDQVDRDYSNLNSKENLLHSDLIDDLMGYHMLTSVAPQVVPTGKTEGKENPFTNKERSDVVESSTEPSFGTFLNSVEYNELLNAKNPVEDINVDLNLLTTNTRLILPGENKENAQSIDYFTESSAM